MPGLPDVMFCDEKGNFHLVELKFCNGNKVGLRPHQVAFMTRHKHASVWIMVKHKKITEKDYRILLFKGEELFKKNSFDLAIKAYEECIS